MSDTENGGPDANAPGGNQPPMVVMGASAGGIRALQEFFAAMPPDTGAAFIVVVHLDPAHRSELPQILATRTRMEVGQVGQVGRTKLLANHVYVIPPDRNLRVVDHEVYAAAFDEPRGQRAPIDVLFRSVAQQLGDGFAVILSGAGSDGALGVRAVKESGGIILVQDPNEAEYSSMPRSAVATGAADLVLPVHELALRLADLIRLKKQGVRLIDEPLVDEDLLRRILAHLRSRTGHDFSKYKRSTVLRRIARRMQVTRSAEIKDYYNVLREQTEEAQALLSDLLISVTTFFRDGEVFELLQRAVIPQLFSARVESIRIWVAGCATGEEAYSIGMLLLEESAKHELRPALQVFGSDLDARALTTAREGRYPVAIETDVSEERLRRFFLREGDQYRVRQELRDIVLYAAHDLVKDPPFSHLDLVSCRNVLIYLDRELQEQVCGTFHYALNPGGFLILGTSESADHPPDLFRIVDRNARIYASTALAGEKPRMLPSLLAPMRVREQQVPHIGRPLSPTAALSEAAMHRRALEKLAPPSIMVDETQRVLHMSETAGRYLQPSGGALSSDVVDLVRQELRFELRSALHRLFEQRQPTLSLPVLVRFNGNRHRVQLHVKAAEQGEEQPSNAIIMFVEGDAVADNFATDSVEVNTDLVRRLSQELEFTQGRLRTVREESDAANEELRAANEELQSINEEYRSTSEELETSKEELQSINEELQTVNSELKLKLEMVSRAHSDLQNLMASTDYGTLFLDSNLRIKRYTERVTDLFSLTPADEGRPITDFAHQLDYDDLTRDARAVLSELAPVRREIATSTDRWYDVRMRPYRTLDNKIDGVVITFVDITERRAVEEDLRQQKMLVEMSREPIYIWDFDGGIIDWNRGCEELYGYTRQEAVGKRKEQLLGTTVPGSSLEEKRARLVAEGHWDGELRQRAKNGRMLIVEAHLDFEIVDGRRLVLESVRDVTQRRSLQERQQLLLGELTHRVKNTLAVVQAIAHQTEATSSSPSQFVERFSGRLVALANAHGLLVHSDWQGADLAALTRVQLLAHAADAGRVHVEGPPVSLSAELATPFSLVLHELATNAAKYGALAQPSGKVGVTWDLTGRDGTRVLRLTWRETGGANPGESSSAGLGSQLIENAIPGAKVRRQFDEQGLACTIELPFPTELGDARLS